MKISGSISDRELITSTLHPASYLLDAIRAKGIPVPLALWEADPSVFGDYELNERVKNLLLSVVNGYSMRRCDRDLNWTVYL